MSTRHQNVVVIGAGAAGLTAALEISQAGHNVVLLEARNRIGGRIYTQHHSNVAASVELGAEFVHGKPPHTLRMISDAHLMLCEATERHWFLDNHDQRKKPVFQRSDEFWHKLQKLMDGMKQHKGADVSVYDFVKRSRADEETKEIVTHYIQGFHAANTSRLGIRELNYVNAAADEIESDHNYRLLNGYGSLIGYLRDQAFLHNTRIRLNSIVKGIAWKPNHVLVTYDRGGAIHKIEASRAVVTIPLGVMQAPADERASIAIQPEVKQKQDAIQALAMGNVFKINCVFREPFWEDFHFRTTDGTESGSEIAFIHAPACAVPTWWTQLPVHVPMFVGWAGGPVADQLRQNKKDLIHSALDSLSEILGAPRNKIDRLLLKAYFHDWYSDPFSLGAYSYLPVHGISAQKELARPVQDTLFFAGEACDTSGHCGTVHGAITSGMRAAQELLSSV